MGINHFDVMNAVCESREFSMIINNKARIPKCKHNTNTHTIIDKHTQIENENENGKKKKKKKSYLKKSSVSPFIIFCRRNVCSGRG
jgi:hypothetical protein